MEEIQKIASRKHFTDLWKLHKVVLYVTIFFDIFKISRNAKYENIKSLEQFDMYPEFWTHINYVLDFFICKGGGRSATLWEKTDIHG